MKTINKFTRSRWSMPVVILIAAALVVLYALACAGPERPPLPLTGATITDLGDTLAVDFEPGIPYELAKLRMSGPLPSNGRYRVIETKLFDGRHRFKIAIADYLTPDADGRIYASVGVTICPALDSAERECFSYFTSFERLER